VPAVAKHQSGPEQGQPDHRVTRYLFDPENRVAREKAQRDVRKYHQCHRGEQQNQQSAVGPQENRVELR
jgi:hypothetical protein